MSEVANSKPPANALLIVDPYIFKGWHYKKMSYKSFVTLYKAKVKDFHVSIITKYRNEDMNKIICELQRLNGIKHEILIYDDEPSLIRDRKIYSNYCTITIGHPFENIKSSYITQNFLGFPSNKKRLQTDYNNFRERLNIWRAIIKNLKEQSNGVGNIFWRTHDFANRLFENLD